MPRGIHLGTKRTARTAPEIKTRFPIGQKAPPNGVGPIPSATLVENKISKEWSDQELHYLVYCLKLQQRFFFAPAVIKKQRITFKQTAYNYLG